MKWGQFLLHETGMVSGTFRVSWEIRDGGFLTGDFTPDRGEEPLRSEEEAWKVAERVAKTFPNAVNIYVISAKDFTPVKGYLSRLIRRYPGARLRTARGEMQMDINAILNNRKRYDFQEAIQAIRVMVEDRDGGAS